MSEFIDQLKKLAIEYKGTGARFGKAFLVEYFLEANHDDIVAQVAAVLSYLTPKDITDYIRKGEVPPIPPSFFHKLKPFESWLAGYEPERFFELVAEASPEKAKVVMEMGEAGILYFVNLKQYVLDNVRALNPDEVTSPGDDGEEDLPTRSMKKLTCEACQESWTVPEEEVNQITECPYCHAPA